jgi:hypothetical protein
LITAHAKDHCTLWDGETDHHVKHADFGWMKPHDKGGIHPAVTEDHQGYLHIPDGLDLSLCPVKPVMIDHPDPTRPGKTLAATYLPIKAQLQALYGPDNQIVSVPINGDAGAQRLHWVRRTPEEQQEMKAILKCLDAWRLTEDGEMPGEGDRVVHGHYDHNVAMETARNEKER